MLFLAVALIPSLVECNPVVDQKKVESIKKYIENKKEQEDLIFPKGNPMPPETPKKPVVAVRTAQVSNMTEAQAKAWIISKEGGATSVNPTSFACGAPQSLPCSKILNYAGVDLSKYNLNTYQGTKAAISTVPLSVQEAWMDKYVMGRYGSYQAARAFWLSHRWY